MAIVQVKRVVEEIKDFPGLGRRIKEAREADSRTLSQICLEAKISRAYWYQLENEDLRSPASEEMIRRVEQVLGVALNVQFEQGDRP